MKNETLTVKTDDYGTVRHFNAAGKLHNPHCPAVVRADGSKGYFLDGKLHNDNGPAVIRANGSKEYWINGDELTKSEYKTWQKQQAAPLHNKTITIDGIEYKLTAK